MSSTTVLIPGREKRSWRHGFPSLRAVKMFGHQTYLIFELGWALPVLLLHWIVGWRRLAPRLGIILIAALSATAYLSVADGVAIHTGIWTLHADRLLGPALDRVPLEESLFFLLTNLMVAQTIVLLRRSPRPVSGLPGRRPPWGRSACRGK